MMKKDTFHKISPEQIENLKFLDVIAKYCLKYSQYNL